MSASPQTHGPTDTHDDVPVTVSDLKITDGGPRRTSDDSALVPRATTTARRAAAYGRKSDPNEAAVRGQWETCRQRAQDDAFEIPEHPAFLFGDDDTTGRSTSRPEMDRLLEVVRSKRAPFDRIYVRDLDRLARTDDPRYFNWFCYECERYGVTVCIATDTKHVDYSKGGSDVQVDMVMKSMKASMASEEIVVLKRRVRIAVRARVKEGFHVVPAHPFGTVRWLATYPGRVPVEPMPERGSLKRDDHAIILQWDESKLPAVRFIFEGLSQGSAARAIARALNKRCFPSPKMGGRWTATRVNRIARNPIYMGDYVYRRTRVGAESPVPATAAKLDGFESFVVRNYMPSPPISVALFERVRAMLDGNANVHHRRMHSRPEFLLTGLLKCAVCGRAVHGFTHRGNRHGRYRMYRHAPAQTQAAERETGLPAQARKAQCPYANNYVRAEPIEHEILTLVRSLLNDDHLLKLAGDQLALLRGERLQDRSTEISACERELAELRAQLREAVKHQQIASAKGNDVLASVHEESATELSTRVAELTRVLELLRHEEERFRQAEGQLPKLAPAISSLVELFDDAVVSRKDVLRILLERIELDLEARVAHAYVRLPANGIVLPAVQPAA